MSEMEARKPTVDFIIVGAQKTGTTALFRMLKKHQNIFSPQRKELHFFDNDYAIDWACPDYTSYESNFVDKTDGQVAGEATPIYSYWPPCVERIKAYNPDIKLILCIRDSAERAFSHWSMEFARQLETMEFSGAIRQGRERVGHGQHSLDGHHRYFSYIERGFYARQISNILIHFPKEQLLVVTFDAFQRDLNNFLDTICRFLCVPQFSNYPKGRSLSQMKADPAVKSLDQREREYLLTLFEGDIRETQELTGLDLSAWLR
jgi:hypothetical protein